MNCGVLKEVIRRVIRWLLCWRFEKHIHSREGKVPAFTHWKISNLLRRSIRFKLGAKAVVTWPRFRPWPFYDGWQQLNTFHCIACLAVRWKRLGPKVNRLSHDDATVIVFTPQDSCSTKIASISLFPYFDGQKKSCVGVVHGVEPIVPLRTRIPVIQPPPQAWHMDILPVDHWHLVLGRRSQAP